MEDMTEKELITVLIDKYTDLQRIKRANNGVENQELEYQIKVTMAWHQIVKENCCCLHNRCEQQQETDGGKYKR